MSNFETDLLRSAEDAINLRLPIHWRVRISTSQTVQSDGTLSITSPSGETIEFDVEIKTQVHPVDVAALQERFNKSIDSNSQRQGLIVARYVSESTRNKLNDAGLSYIDATGNMRIVSSNPALFIADAGEKKDPWRGPGRPKATLAGEPAAKVVRTLLDFSGPWRIRDLVEKSQTSTGSVYRVVEFLETQALITRDDQNRIVAPNWAAVLRRWGDNYGYLSSNKTTRWIAPQGIEPVVELLKTNQKLEYFATGSLAAATWSEYAPTRPLTLYSPRPNDLASYLGLRETDTGANVLIAQPAFNVLTERAFEREDGVHVVMPTQVAADLLNGPGRAPVEAEALLEWMGEHESHWRR